MSLINVGLTGLLGHQAALNTTGNNITNANTPGYSRQQTVFDTQPGIQSGAGTIGTGVKVTDIRRITDQFVTDQVRSDTSLFNEQETLNKELSGLDNLLGGESTGLNDSLNKFFNSLKSAAEDPSSLPQRQVVLSEAQGLVNRFQGLQQRFIQQRESVNGQLQAGASDVNSLLSSIADINRSISETPGLAQGREPNSLLDQRDEKLRQLSELVNVRTTAAQGGQVNVSLSSGQSLVVGGEAAQLQTVKGDADPNQLEFSLSSGNRVTNVTNQIVGGKLGGLRTFQKEALSQAFGDLGKLATAVAQQVNKQHEIGMDLEGDLGGRFFTDVNSREAQLGRITPNAGNQPPRDGVVSAEITDSAQLQGRSYTLSFADNSNFEVIDETTGETVRQGQLPDPLPAEVSLPGFNLKIESGTFSEGDSYRVHPTQNAAANLSLQIRREEDLALASPVTAIADSGNTGAGEISQGTMLGVRDPVTNQQLDQFSQRGELSPPLVVRFARPVPDTDPTAPPVYEILDGSDPTNLKPLSPPVPPQTFQPGVQNKLFSENPSDANYRGFQFEIGGTPKANDVFSINYNTDGTSDNRNAGLLGGLGTKNTLNGGTQSFSEGYGTLVEKVGVTTRQSQLDKDAGSALLEQSTNQRESISGVNLDEEAGRLVQYRAAYNASAQVMSTAQDLFDTLLSTFR